MRRSRFAGCFGLLAWLLLGACRDQSPTAIGDEFFPAAGRPVTVELAAALDSFQVLGRFAGYTGASDASFSIVANRFDGVLDAATLARVRGLPTFVNVVVNGSTQVDSTFAYLGGELVFPIDTANTEVVAGPVTLELRALARGPGSDTVFERTGADTTGSRLLATTRLAAADPFTVDTVRFALDSLQVRQIATSQFPGLLLRASGSPARVQLGQLSLRTSVRPSLRRDTTIAVSSGASPQTFIFSPEPPLPSNALVAGGLRSARTLFRLVLPDSVPACSGSACAARVALRDVSINEAALVLEPLSVPGGFRPLGPVPLQLRRVSDPELGARAPLGEIVRDPAGFDAATGAGVFSPILFTPGQATPVIVPITGHVQALAARDSTGLAQQGRGTALALLGEPEVATFGPALFRATPRLRLIYTLPVRSGSR